MGLRRTILSIGKDDSKSKSSSPPHSHFHSFKELAKENSLPQLWQINIDMRVEKILHLLKRFWYYLNPWSFNLIVDLISVRLKEVWSVSKLIDSQHLWSWTSITIGNGSHYRSLEVWSFKQFQLYGLSRSWSNGKEEVGIKWLLRNREVKYSINILFPFNHHLINFLFPLN